MSVKDYFVIQQNAAAIDWSALLNHPVRITVEQENPDDSGDPKRTWDLVGMLIGYFRGEDRVTLAFQGFVKELPVNTRYTVKILNANI